MGRPRKRRRAEEDDGANGDSGTFEDSALGGLHNATQDPVFAGFPSNGHSQNELPFAGNELGTASWPTPGGSEANSHGNGDFNFHFAQDPAIDPMLGFPAWESTQHISNPFSNPAQLQTPPTTLDYDIPNNVYEAQGSQQTCSCLPNLYRTLASFQSLPPPSFPFSIGTLKKAARLAHDVVQCQICPQTYNTAVQNSMLLGTLMQMLMNEYAKLLNYIDERSSSGEKIPFRVGEPSSSFDTRHTGGPDCPMSIIIDLSGGEWRLLARKAVHQEIHGDDEAVNQSLIAIVQEMRNRQGELHERFTSEVHVSGHDHTEEAKKSGEHICVQILYIDNLKKSLEMLKV